MNIGIIGVGGVGGYFGGKLAKLLNTRDDLKVYFLARGKHLEEIKKNGLHLCTKHEGDFWVTPTLATDHADDLPHLDLCLLCVKGYDLENALISIKNKVDRNTQIIPLLNGVDIYDRVKRALGDAIIFPACVYVGTHIESPGKISQDAGGRILFGKDPAHPLQRPQAIVDLFDAANIRYTFFEDVSAEIWGKYIFIAAYSMVAACQNQNIGQIGEDTVSSQMVKGIMAEIQMIAEKKGVKLSENIVEETFNKGKIFPSDSKTSFQRDFEQRDKQNESELFGDTIIRLGKEVGVDTPVTCSVNQQLKSMKA